MKLKDVCSLEGKLWKTYTVYLKAEKSLCRQSPHSQSHGFSHSHEQMWELDHRKGWAPKNWCFQIMVLEKTLENLLDCKEIKSVSHKRYQPWVFNGRTDAEAEGPVLWPPDEKSWLTGKDLMLGKTEGKRRRGQQKMRWLGHIIDSMDVNLSDFCPLGQTSLACCSPWGHKGSDTAQWLNNSNSCVNNSNILVDLMWLQLSLYERGRGKLDYRSREVTVELDVWWIQKETGRQEMQAASKSGKSQGQWILQWCLQTSGLAQLTLDFRLLTSRIVGVDVYGVGYSVCGGLFQQQQESRTLPSFTPAVMV